MSFWPTLWCLVVHWRKHQTWERSRKCRKCGLYLRSGPASERWRRNRDA